MLWLSWGHHAGGSPGESREPTGDFCFYHSAIFALFVPLPSQQFPSFSMAGAEACFAAVSMYWSLLCELQVKLLWEQRRCKTWLTAFWQHTPRMLLLSIKKCSGSLKPATRRLLLCSQTFPSESMLAGGWKPAPEPTPRLCLPALAAVRREENCRGSPPSALPLIFSVMSALIPYVPHLRCKGLMTPTYKIHRLTKQTKVLWFSFLNKRHLCAQLRLGTGQENKHTADVSRADQWMQRDTGKWWHHAKLHGSQRRAGPGQQQDRLQAPASMAGCAIRARNSGAAGSWAGRKGNKYLAPAFGRKPDAAFLSRG